MNSTQGIKSVTARGQPIEAALPRVVALAIAGPLALLATSTAWTWCAWRYFGEAVSRSERQGLRASLWASDLPATACSGATIVLILSVAIYLFTRRHAFLGALLFLYGIAIVIAIAFVSVLLVPFKPPGL